MAPCTGARLPAPDAPRPRWWTGRARAGAGRAVAAAAATLAVAACASSLEPGEPPPFAADPDGIPVIASGQAGLPMYPLDPGVYADGEGYHLFYTTPFCQSANGPRYSWDPANVAACDLDVTTTTIGYAFSSDAGRTWQFRATPVILPPGSGFDGSKIETAFPFRRGDTLYLVYSAEGVRDGATFTLRYQIGLGRLPLGGQSIRTVLMDESRQFTRQTTPLLPYDLRAGRFDNNVQEPSLAVGPDGLALYYIGLGLSLPDQPITAPGQEITSVGLGRAELDAGFAVTSRAEAALLADVNITEVRYFDGAFHLFATTRGSGEFHQGERIGYARSADGRTWPAPAVVLAGGTGGHDNWGLMAPTVAVEDGRLVLFHTAFGVVQQPCFPVPADGRFGRPVGGGAACVYTSVGRAVASRP